MPGLEDIANRPPASKTQYALERLREDIASGALHPGEALRQSDLAKRYGVSPTPVREALRLLESDGLVVYSPHRGATVMHLDEQRTQDLYALRARTEGLATELCAVRRTDEQLEEMRELQERLRTMAQDPSVSHVELAAWNRELHLRIAGIGSAAIAGQIRPMLGAFPTHRTMWRKSGRVQSFLSDHDAIISAIAESDPSRAGTLMHQHILSALDERRGDPSEYIPG